MISSLEPTCNHSIRLLRKEILKYIMTATQTLWCFLLILQLKKHILWPWRDRIGTAAEWLGTWECWRAKGLQLSAQDVDCEHFGCLFKPSRNWQDWPEISGAPWTGDDCKAHSEQRYFIQMNEIVQGNRNHFARRASRQAQICTRCILVRSILEMLVCDWHVMSGNDFWTIKACMQYGWHCVWKGR